METLDLIEVAPALAAAIVAAQLAAESVPKRGHNKQLGKKYATADDIAAAAKKALNANGAAFVRVGVDLDTGKLADFDLGNQGYAGDSVETWMLIHESGAALVGTQRVPIVVSKGRPHEKALSATLTYADGFALRGILCLEREEPGNNVDARDDDPGQDRIQRRSTAHQATDLGPRCSGPKGGHIGEAIDRHVRAIHDDGGRPLSDVWTWGIKSAAIDFLKYDGGWPQTAQQLTIGDGMKLRDFLKSQRPREPGNEGAP